MFKSIPGFMVGLLIAISFYFFTGQACFVGIKWVLGQDAEEGVARKNKEEVDQLLDRARNAPPEIAADIIFQLIESGVALNNSRKERLLEDLFDLSYSVQNKVKLSGAIDKVDSHIGSLEHAYRLNLDALSIQSRVVRLMISVNADRSVELFKRITLPETETLSCQNLMVYDYALYYETLKDLINRALEDKENRQLERRNLIGNAISSVTSPLQINAVAKMLANLDLGQDDLSYFIPAFVSKLKNLSGDPRSYSWTLRVIETGIRNLMVECKTKRVVYDGLVDGYRAFLVENMADGMCNDFSDNTKIFEDVKRSTEHFNLILSESYPSGNSQIPPLQVKQMYPKKVEKSAAVTEYTKTPVGSKLLLGIQSLNFDLKGEQRSSADKEKVAWKNELVTFYNYFKSNAVEDSLTEIENFHRKCDIFGVLLQIVPQSNPKYDDILKDYISFISQNRTQQENVIEWLWQARVVLLRMKLTKQSPDSVLKALSDSGDELLKLIAETRLFIAKNK